MSLSKRPFSVRVRLGMLVLLALAPVVGLLFYAAQEQGRESASNARSKALDLVKIAALAQEYLVTETSQLLSFAAGNPAVQSGDPAACNAYLAELLKQYPLYTSLVVADLKGDLYCSAIPLAGPTNVAARPHFQRAVATREFTVGGYSVGQTTGKAILSFGSPVISPQGELKGVAFAGLDLSWLNGLITTTQLQLPPGSVLHVVDSNGIILARYLNPQEWVGKTVLEQPLVQHILAARGEGTVDGPSLDGIPSLFAFTFLGPPTTTGSVYVAVGIPQSLAYAPARAALQRNLLGLGVAAAVALAVVWFGIELVVTRPVRVLIRATQRVAAGDLKARSGLNPRNVGELGQLAEAFDRMALDLEEREGERARIEQDRLQLTEERVRRARSETLLEEVQHRVKNSLQVAASLLSLQADKLQDPAGQTALKESEARLRTMAIVHAKLFAQEGTALLDFGAHLREIVPAMIEAQTEPAKISWQISADQVLLEWDTAVPCALIVNELVTNALKHAFPGGRQGAVQIGLHEEERGRFVLRVRDDGVGFPAHIDYRNSDSLGLQLVQALTKQLHGTIELERGTSTLFTVRFSAIEKRGL